MDLSFIQLLFEALGQDLPDYLKKEVGNTWGKKYLHYTPRPKTSKIIDGQYSIPNTVKSQFLNSLFNFNVTAITKSLDELKKNLSSVNLLGYFNEYVNNSFIDHNYKFDIDSIWITDIRYLLQNMLYLPSIKECKLQNKLVLSKNTVNFNKWFNAFQLIFDQKIPNPFLNPQISSINSLITDNNFDLDLFTNNHLYLYVTGKPSDILTMSISKFYDSCQNLYDGSQKYKLLSNVFDPGMKAAFIIMDTPYIDNNGNEHPYTAIARVSLREQEGKIYTQNFYPPRISPEFISILFQFGYELQNSKIVFKLDPSTIHGLSDPYIEGDIIGVNYDFGLSDKQKLEAEKVGHFGNQGDFTKLSRKQRLYLIYKLRYNDKLFSYFLNEEQILFWVNICNDAFMLNQILNYCKQHNVLTSTIKITFLQHNPNFISKFTNITKHEIFNALSQYNYSFDEKTQMFFNSLKKESKLKILKINSKFETYISDQILQSDPDYFLAIIDGIEEDSNIQNNVLSRFSIASHHIKLLLCEKIAKVANPYGIRSISESDIFHDQIPQDVQEVFCNSPQPEIVTLIFRYGLWSSFSDKSHILLFKKYPERILMRINDFFPTQNLYERSLNKANNHFFMTLCDYQELIPSRIWKLPQTKTLIDNMKIRFPEKAEELENKIDQNSKAP